MDDGQEQDQYEERLKEVFNSFDASGCGSLCPEELSDLCQSLHLDDATPALLQVLLQNQDRLTARVDFDQFKNALILVLSSTIEPPQAEPEPLPKPESPEIQPKFVKGSKRYGRRSTPEFIEPISDLSEVPNISPADGEDLEDNYDSAVPRKREMAASTKTNTIRDTGLKRVLVLTNLGCNNATMSGLGDQQMGMGQGAPPETAGLELREEEGVGL